jgi:hypothetical protein
VGKTPKQKLVLIHVTSEGELRIDSFSKSLCIEEKIEDTKWVIRGRKSKEYRIQNIREKKKPPQGTLYYIPVNRTYFL